MAGAVFEQVSSGGGEEEGRVSSRRSSSSSSCALCPMTRLLPGGGGGGGGPSEKVERALGNLLKFLTVEKSPPPSRSDGGGSGDGIIMEVEEGVGGVEGIMMAGWLCDFCSTLLINTNNYLEHFDAFRRALISSLHELSDRLGLTLTTVGGGGGGITGEEVGFIQDIFRMSGLAIEQLTAVGRVVREPTTTTVVAPMPPPPPPPQIHSEEGGRRQAGGDLADADDQARDSNSGSLEEGRRESVEGPVEPPPPQQQQRGVVVEGSGSGGQVKNPPPQVEGVVTEQEEVGGDGDEVPSYEKCDSSTLLTMSMPTPGSSHHLQASAQDYSRNNVTELEGEPKRMSVFDRDPERYRQLLPLLSVDPQFLLAVERKLKARRESHHHHQRQVGRDDNAPGARGSIIQEGGDDVVVPGGQPGGQSGVELQERAGVKRGDGSSYPSSAHAKKQVEINSETSTPPSDAPMEVVESDDAGMSGGTVGASKSNPSGSSPRTIVNPPPPPTPRAKLENPGSGLDNREGGGGGGGPGERIFGQLRAIQQLEAMPGGVVIARGLTVTPPQPPSQVGGEEEEQQDQMQEGGRDAVADTVAGGSFSMEGRRGRLPLGSGAEEAGGEKGINNVPQGDEQLIIDEGNKGTGMWRDGSNSAGSSSSENDFEEGLSESDSDDSSSSFQSEDYYVLTRGNSQAAVRDSAGGNVITAEGRGGRGGPKKFILNKSSSSNDAKVMNDPVLRPPAQQTRLHTLKRKREETDEDQEGVHHTHPERQRKAAAGGGGDLGGACRTSSPAPAHAERVEKNRQASSSTPSRMEEKLVVLPSSSRRGGGGGEKADNTGMEMERRDGPEEEVVNNESIPSGAGQNVGGKNPGFSDMEREGGGDGGGGGVPGGVLVTSTTTPTADPRQCLYCKKRSVQANVNQEHMMCCHAVLHFKGVMPPGATDAQVEEAIGKIQLQEKLICSAPKPRKFFCQLCGGGGIEVEVTAPSMKSHLLSKHLMQVISRMGSSSSSSRPPPAPVDNGGGAAAPSSSEASFDEERRIWRCRKCGIAFKDLLVLRGHIARSHNK